MMNLMFDVRDEKLTNEPREVFQLYQQMKNKGKLTRVWHKGDGDAEKLIFDFFSPVPFLKRLYLAYHDKLKNKVQKSMSFFGFYLNLS